jgi:uncharacterized protein (DUF302 family)
MLPCNILVQEHENGKVEISAINPMETMGVVNNEKFVALAAKVSGKLRGVINQL